MRAFAIVAMMGCTYAYSTFPAHNVAPASVLAGSAPTQRRTNSLTADVAVRRTPVSWSDIITVTSRGPQVSSLAAAAPPVASPLTPAVADEANIVIEMWLVVQTSEVARVAAEATEWTRAAGGRVVSSNVQAQHGASSAALELRVPPAKAHELATWIGTRGHVDEQRMLASDVGKVMLDHELELKNLDIEMTRLQDLAKRDGPIEKLLEIEKELTRVRGEIESAKGELQFLHDRVALATITLTLSSDHEDESTLDPSARIYPGAHVATLSLLDPAGRPRSRIGGGIAVAYQRYLSFDLDVFPQTGGDSRAVVATVGGALYSGYLDYGARRWLNPYIGGRLGYGYLSGEGVPVVAGELGVELYKRREIVIDFSTRGLAFFRRVTTDAALHVQLGIAVPF